jgi:hypothetical protein
MPAERTFAAAAAMSPARLPPSRLLPVCGCGCKRERGRERERDREGEREGGRQGGRGDRERDTHTNTHMCE